MSRYSRRGADEHRSTAGGLVSGSNARSVRTRAAILDAAGELVAGGGFAGLSMASVAERAGVTRRAIYLHFPTRSALLDALFDHVSEREGLTESLARVWRAPDAVSAVREWARHLARFHPHVLEIDLAAEAERRIEPEAAAHRAVVIADQRVACRRLVRRLRDERRLAPPWTVPTATDMVWSLMSSALVRALLVDRDWSTAKFARRMGDLLVATFVSEPPTAG